MVLMVRISNVSHLDNIEVPAVNPALYKIWFRTYAAHLVSEFSWLTSMQRELLEQGQITAHIGQPVPKGDNDWKRLFQELGLLKDSFGYIRTYSDYHEDVDTGSWDGETEGAMGCPLLLSPIAELENRSLDEEQLVGAVLTRLGVDERVHPYYFVQRVPFDDREQCSNLLHDFRVGLRFVDPVLDPVDYDAHEGWWLTQAEQLIAKCVAFGMEELIHISVRDPYNDLGTNDGWYGNFCHFALCKQKDANQRVLGWVMSYSP
ncbi:hypothetical protein BC832DRAFT_594819 [Gaertneriomyces semiglobifer]|nr:hypothetical protein BC832DRAFT_594819 [Gaertneriomyces semiglobifer]